MDAGGDLAKDRFSDAQRPRRWRSLCPDRDAARGRVYSAADIDDVTDAERLTFRTLASTERD